MRATGLHVLFAAVVAGAACGDNNTVAIDAAPDMGGIGTKCADGIDNDGDGLIDYPADPGCVAPQADDETDDCPSGPGCPQCGNDRDDDGNGLTDYPDDPGCTSASDTTEFVENPVACGATLMIKNLPPTGSDTGTLDSTSTSQITTPCGGGGGASAIAYRLNLAMPTVIVADTAGSAFDTVLDLRSADCEDPTAEVACHDDVSSSNDTSKLTESVPAGNYFLIVSGADTSEVGQYVINVQRFTGEGAACTATAMCGPGLVCRAPGGTTNMVCTVPQCADTYDDDGDTKNGYPDDPGCASLTDNDETDDCPSGVGCPACANGTDDDMDGLTDYPLDTSCTAASGGSESCNGEQDPIVAITGGTTNGTLVGAHDDHDPSCVAPNGVDVLYTLTIPTMRSLIVDTETTSVDTVLSLLDSTCEEPSLACDDEGGAVFGASRIVRNNVAAGTYIVAVDAYSSSTTLGAFPLHVSGVISPGGRCEPELTLGGALACPVTNPCVSIGGEMKCEPSACGDGIDNDTPLDGLVDFPDDPGCTSLDDMDESDTCADGPGPGCPECADGEDNDGDGDVDGVDSNCLTPGTPSEGCVATEGVSELVLPMTPGTTTGATNDMSPACSSATNTAADLVYSLQLPEMLNLTVTSEPNNFDTVVSLLGSTCSGTPIACSDTPEQVTTANLPAGNYFFVVDGYGSSAGGTFSVGVRGTIRNGASCEVPLAMSGALTCANGFACKGVTGARTCRPAACNDGLDNDTDGIADYPNDPGCTSRSDDDETDACPGAGCPACGNGVDDDLDGDFDYPDDQGCSSASGTSEVLFCPSETSTIGQITATPITGTTVGAMNDFASHTCQSNASGPDLVLALQLPVPVDTLVLDLTNSGFDTILSLRDALCGTQIGCGDDQTTPSSTRSKLTVTGVSAGDYSVVIDGWNGASGAYELDIRGTVATGTACDSPLFASGVLECPMGTTCSGTPMTCQ